MIDFEQIQAADDYSYSNPVFVDGEPQTLGNLIELDVTFAWHDTYTGINTPKTVTVKRTDVLDHRSNLVGEREELDAADVVLAAKETSMTSLITDITTYVGSL